MHERMIRMAKDEQANVSGTQVDETPATGFPGIEDILKRMNEYEARIKQQDAKIKELSKAKPSVADTGSVPSEIRANENYMNELVEIELFYDGQKYKDDVFVAVNGKSYLIQRGKRVKVPRFVKEVLDNSADQDKRAAEYIVMMTQDYENKRQQFDAD